MAITCHYTLRKKIIQFIFTRQQRYMFNQLKKITITVWSGLLDINIHYYMSIEIPVMHRISFDRSAHNEQNIGNFCSNLDDIFNRVCLRWFIYNNSQSDINKSLIGNRLTIRFPLQNCTPLILR